jgi:hypothetical protein
MAELRQFSMRKDADECRSFKICSRQLCPNYAAGTSGSTTVLVGIARRLM